MPHRYHSFSFNVTTPTVLPTLSLHDALPICWAAAAPGGGAAGAIVDGALPNNAATADSNVGPYASRSCIASTTRRSEEHTSELQSRRELVCRLLLEKKNPICSRSLSHQIKGL